MKRLYRLLERDDVRVEERDLLFTLFRCVVVVFRFVCTRFRCVVVLFWDVLLRVDDLALRLGFSVFAGARPTFTLPRCCG